MNKKLLVFYYCLDIDDVVEDDKESESGFTVNFENNQCTLSSEHFSHIQNKIQTAAKQVNNNETILFIIFFCFLDVFMFQLIFFRFDLIAGVIFKR